MKVSELLNPSSLADIAELSTPAPRSPKCLTIPTCPNCSPGIPVNIPANTPTSIPMHISASAPASIPANISTNVPTGIPLSYCLKRPRPLRPNVSKPRRRFTGEEDRIILEGVARKMTWGEIASRLNSRKRATCYNRFQTLQGIRKSRPNVASTTPLSSGSSVSPVSSPDSYFTAGYTTTRQLLNANNMLPRQQQKVSYQFVPHQHHLPLFSYSRYSV